MSLTLANAIKQIEKLEKESIALKDELTVFKKSPYYLSYTTILSQVNDYCRQIQTSIDINDPESKDAFAMRWKFTQELPTLLINLDAMREKMSATEQKQADKLREDSLVEHQADKWKRGQ
jgi:uncharacterized membrane protein YgaE (UPF0421/DUF939 family)